MKTNQPNITKLIARCKTSDKNAQLQIYNAYYKAMYNTAVRILKDGFEAEDIMQEAFLSAFTKIHTYSGEVTFGAWLKRIVINKSLTQLKKQQKYDAVKMKVIYNETYENDNNDLAIDYNKINVQEVLKTLQSLKDNYRVILTLNLIEGYDYEEIAHILNYSNENVRTTISRAKKKLKQVLLAKNTNTQVYGK